MVSGHTDDGFRSNNLGGLKLDNDPPDDDYQVVEINLVARGFVVLAFDPIGQGERMQYADIPAGRPDPAEPWGKGAPGSFVWGPTSDHEYIGREASPCTAPARYPGTVSQDVAWARGLTGCGVCVAADAGPHRPAAPQRCRADVFLAARRDDRRRSAGKLAERGPPQPRRARRFHLEIGPC
eukprot:COSAG01_NODE_33704_length_560_cov_0.783080_1_plen_181_part_10